MQLVLMHGTGNRFAVLDAFRETLPAEEDLPKLARSLGDRSAGIGVDGLLIVEPAEGVAGRMRVYNADGSVAEMCGNGLRCVAKLLADRLKLSRFTIATDAGPRDVEIMATRGDVSDVRVSLGRPIFEPTRIPTTFEGTPPTEVALVLADYVIHLTCLSLGNPHAVVFVADPDSVAVEQLGPNIEQHPAFPKRTNVEFVAVTSPNELRLRVWERGVGETAACGTGAAAAAVAGMLTGRTGRSVTAHLRGGKLHIDWPTDDAEITLTGEAVLLDTIEWPLSS
jgi:diaminopimelate epimerase